MSVTAFKLDTVEACGHRLDARLQKLIEDVWASLKQDVRNTFTTYWNDATNHWLFKGPIFAQNNVPTTGQPIFGAHDFNGFLYRFAEEPLPNSTDAEVKDLIAHELAHGHYYASGDRKKKSRGLHPINYWTYANSTRTA